MGIHLMGMHIIDVHLMSLHLISLHLIGIRLMGISHRRASDGHGFSWACTNSLALELLSLAPKLLASQQYILGTISLEAESKAIGCR